MSGANDDTRFPPPEPERVERALRAMHARRAKLRRVRMIGISGPLVVIAAVAVAGVISLPNTRPDNRAAEPSSTTSAATNPSTAPTTTTMAPTTTTTTSTPSTPTTSSVPGTQQITYQPFTATGAIDPTLQVTSSVTGTCLSEESSRSYRCFQNSGGGIYDPCFAGPQGTTQPLVCPSNPATPDVVQFTATSVTSQPPVTTTRPWAMQLSSGQVCLFVSAAWGGLGPYGCQPDNSLVSLAADCRQPQPSQPAWTAECQDQNNNASPFAPTEVTKIWF